MKKLILAFIIGSFLTSCLEANSGDKPEKENRNISFKKYHI